MKKLIKFRQSFFGIAAVFTAIYFLVICAILFSVRYFGGWVNALTLDDYSKIFAIIGSVASPFGFLAIVYSILIYQDQTKRESMSRLVSSPAFLELGLLFHEKTHEQVLNWLDTLDKISNFIPDADIKSGLKGQVIMIREEENKENAQRSDRDKLSILAKISLFVDELESCVGRRVINAPGIEYIALLARVLDGEIISFERENREYYEKIDNYAEKMGHDYSNVPRNVVFVGKRIFNFVQDHWRKMN
jgi:hypothetical protein